jgi:hypothetical protein
MILIKKIIKHLYNLIINKILILFLGKVKEANIEEIEFEENIIYEKDEFAMPELVDIFGNKENNFSGYVTNIPCLKVRQFDNFYCFSNKEEIYNSEKELIHEYTSQNKNPIIGKSKIAFFKKEVIYYDATVAHLSLSGLENNYFHFLTECMSRYFLIQKSTFKPDFYIISDHLKFQKDILKLLGIEEKCIISANQNLLICAKKLIIADFVNNHYKLKIRGYLASHKLWIPSWLSKCYTEAFSGLLTKNLNTKNIYISRQKASYRKFINHLEIQEIIDNHGFETYFLEEMSVIEQINLFSSAERIIGLHGAGFANLYFAPRNVKILEIYSEFYHHPSSRILAKNNNLNYSYIVGSTFNRNIPPQKEDTFLDIELFKIALLNFMNI